MGYIEKLEAFPSRPQETIIKNIHLKFFSLSESKCPCIQKFQYGEHHIHHAKITKTFLPYEIQYKGQGNLNFASKDFFSNIIKAVSASTCLLRLSQFLELRDILPLRGHWWLQKQLKSPGAPGWGSNDLCQGKVLNYSGYYSHQIRRNLTKDSTHSSCYATSGMSHN